jgi:uncharacterized protein (DUF433 family)
MPLDMVSVREASFVVGVPVKTVNKAIDEAKIRRGVTRGQRERLLSRWAVLQLALEKELEQRISMEVRPNVRASFLKAVAAVDHNADIEVRLGDSLILLIECKSIRDRIDQRWRTLSLALDAIVEDPEVQGGAATFKGTRVMVWPIVDALRLGESESELLEHYPALTPEKLEAAKLYAAVRPHRGRPKIVPPVGLATSDRVVKVGRSA